MATLPTSPSISVEEYLSTSYPDGDREYLDGIVVERNLGTPHHSALQKILIGHFIGIEKQFQFAVRPECRTRVTCSRYRVPDLLVMLRPFRQNDRVLLDPPFLIVEIVSPDDRSPRCLNPFPRL